MSDCNHNGHRPRIVKRTRKSAKVHRDSSEYPKQSGWASLHHHSTFSFLDGFQLPEAHVRRAAELGMGALAMTEHGNVSSHVRLEVAAKAAGIKPLFGCELYTGGISKKKTQSKNHLTVIAKDAGGYRNLLRLVSNTYSKGFHYYPTANSRMLREHREGLIVLSGCFSSELFTNLVGGKLIDPADASYLKGKGVARRFKRMFGDNYYLEVQAFPELELTRKANPMIAQIGRELGIPLVATLDCHYTHVESREVQQVLHNIRGGGRKTLEEQIEAWGYAAPLCPLDDKEIERRLVQSGLSLREARAAVATTLEVAGRCNVELPKLDMVRYPTDDAIETMNEWLDRGWRFRRVDRINKYDQRRYSERIRYEKKLIASKDYCDYFLVVADVVSWAKDNGIVVGPARGSAAASLVCWLLRITEVNPMDFPDLVFERFIDVSRDDLPDIDLDFDSDRRSEIREYLVGKYGAEHVGTIGTFITYKPRLALDDVRRVYKESIPMGYVEKIKKMVIERSPNDLRATDCIADTAELFPNVKAIFDLYPDLEVAKKLEGNIKQMGIHAAGLVVSPVPITEVCAIYSNREGVEVISMDKYDAERQGLLKIDVLGLKTMSVIAEMMRDLGVSIDQLYGLPLDDEDVLAGFTANDVIGIFQFEGDATRELTGAIKPDTFTELYAINALSRPGPLHSGAAREYTDVKNGDKKLRLLHPIFDNIVSSTYGQVVYQEQIIRIAREIGGFDEAEASYIRKIISRKLGEQEFERQWSRFWGGAEKVGMTEDVARLIWNMCITSGVYAFNAAHAVSYTIIAYWMMWFKVNSPASFYSASLNYCGPDRTYPLMRDAERHGIYVSPPDYGRGSMRWAGYGDELIGGFQSLHGIGQVMGSAMEAFANERAEAPTSWDDYLQVKGVGPKTIAKLKNFEASDDPYNIHYIDNRVARALEELEKLDPDKKIPRPTHTSATLPTDRSGPDIPVVWAGIVGGINMRNLVDSARARGIEHDPDLVRDPELDEWVVLYASDGDDTVSLNVNRWRYPALRSAIHNITSGRDVVIFEAVKSSNMNSRYLKVKNLWVIDLEDE